MCLKKRWQKMKKKTYSLISLNENPRSSYSMVALPNNDVANNSKYKREEWKLKRMRWGERGNESRRKKAEGSAIQSSLLTALRLC